MLTQASLLPLDRGTVHHPGSGPVVVLLHGLYASAGVFRPLRTCLERTLGAATYSLNYLPGPGISELAARVAEVVRAASESRSIILVGHSLGGLVYRAYCQSPACDARVSLTMSLAGPFYGSRRHVLVPGQAGQDLRPSSPILERIRRASPENLRIPHLSLCAADDQMILGNGCPEYGETQTLFGVGHNGLLFDPRAHAWVTQQIGQNAGSSSPDLG